MTFQLVVVLAAVASSCTLAAPQRPEDDRHNPIIIAPADSIDYCIGIRNPTNNFVCRLQRVRDLVR